MKKVRIRAALAAACLFAASAACTGGGSGAKGLKTIRAEDMKFSMKFLSAVEFRGRSAPSPELDIASGFIALTAERIGLKPLMPGGSFYQEIPADVTSVSEEGTSLTLKAGGVSRVFRYPDAFTPGRSAAAGEAAGDVVFLGFGLSAPGLDWDDYKDLDVKGKIVVFLDAALPAAHVLKPEENRRMLAGRGESARERGAAAAIIIINGDRDARLAEKGVSFDPAVRVRFPDVYTGPGPIPPKSAGSDLRPQSQAPFLQIEARQDLGAALLGVERAELARMAAAIKEGRRVEGRRLPGRRVEIRVETETRRETTPNVVAWAEGRDPSLRGEYITISSHHDHLGVREGRTMPGADDNVSGVAAMFEIAEAVMAERPKRSVIFVWNTAEERGLVGSYAFVEHCPVPVAKISANLDLDMISRNDPDGIYLIGSNKLSSELDASIRAMNDRSSRLKLDYRYEDPGHPDRFFFRSDQYPYIRYGIPGVWFFSGTTEDYHTENDLEAKVDYAKMVKVTKLVYLVAMDIGDKPELLKLDVNPEIKVRGEENMKIAWR